MIEGFDFRQKIKPVRWLVEGFIPREALSFWLAQAGVGKSYIISALVTSIIHGELFLGMKTTSCNVLLIDQDTPTNALQKNLILYKKHYNKEPVCRLYLESMNGYSIRDKGLLAAILKYEDAEVVIIDCLTSICPGVEMIKASEMSRIGELKQELISRGKTLIITHHISEKKEISPHDLMVMDAHGLAMYSSVINQQADMLYIVGNPNAGRNCKELFIRPWSKRYLATVKPFICSLVQEKGEQHLDYVGEYSRGGNEELGDDEKMILDAFETPGVYLFAISVYKAIGYAIGINGVYKILKELTYKKYLKLGKERHNKFKWCLNEEKVILEVKRP